MRRYTTPTHELTVEGHDLTAADRVWVTYRQGGRTWDLEPSSAELSGEDTVLTVELTQEQTGALAVGTARVQVNWMEGARRNATEIAIVQVADNLMPRVVG